MFANSRDDDAVIIVSSIVANFLGKLRSKDGLFSFECSKSIQKLTFRVAVLINFRKF